MTEGTHPDLTAWAVDTSDDAGSFLVEEHLRACPTCADEAARLRAAAGLLAVAAPEPPPAGLRSRVLAAALVQRPNRQRLIEPYSRQVSQLHALLSELDVHALAGHEPNYGSIDGTISHLTDNDTLVAADLGLVAAGASSAREAWHGQAVQLLRGLESDAPLDRPVRMAGRAGLRRPLRDALVQRTFETWIHADDVRRAVDRAPQPPPPEDVSLIIGLGLRLLPMAMRAQGCERPGQWASLTLTGASTSQWRVPLSMDSGDGGDVVRISADAVTYCHLMASRVAVEAFAYEADGDTAAAVDLLRAAATLGCE